ncbi:asparagine synthase [Chryseotalea sanaruensis]|uniref:asparagine synthase (glutamine-hydrolyzing) n=1 Tax=Chryseotalea sanaruensis TaxID=2482724 RepID=A0A401UEW0_9BACT|nr:asparagine synthase (glutamine-hydrolyzing) [Chryseotalea sanaruensis]GCC53441.1 asparagine synthase [Chryseotalea sanaruensis]
MCGITGIYAFNLIGKINKIHVTNATMALEKRGPDFQDIYLDEWVGLGHRRLSIIDTSIIANQPMWDDTQRYCIVFNGEIFNFQELRQILIGKGISFRSQSDTEVLLHLYIHEKENCLSKLNGFFAFCVYDKQEQSFFIARDRFGIKPLLYVHDEDKFIFASEMKAVLQYGIDKELDYESLETYLQLNYIPAPYSIFKSVKKLLPGHYLTLKKREININSYYTIPDTEDKTITFDQAKLKFKDLLEKSVQRRLVADVPLGSFLSGGIDSSVITGIASRHKKNLHTFSIGFKDEKFFDETAYASLVAKHFNTEHTVFSLTNSDLYKHVNNILDYIDEPFADSSAINVYILSQETRKHATVALSGDGADELLAGYNKHAAFYRMIHGGLKENALNALSPLWKILPKSRNNVLTNKVRQFHRFAEGMKLAPQERYWRWAGFASEQEALSLLSKKSKTQLSEEKYNARKTKLLAQLSKNVSMREVLLTDTNLVLPNDMLTKVDLMSMANALEVRVPFLDYEVVNFIFSLPDDYKINHSIRKRVLQEAYRDMLPPALYKRPKKGFEVPLLKWFRYEMRPLIENDLLSRNYIEEQGIFHYPVVEKLKRQLFSNNPGDVHARIWGLIVFQWWYKKVNGS